MDRRRILLGLSSVGAVGAAACGRKMGSAVVDGDHPNVREEPVNPSNVEISLFELGTPPWRTFDPFLFCVHHHDAYPAGNAEMGPAASLAGRNMGQDFAGKDGWRMYHGDKIPGFPRHPHRGFETVTVTRQGYVDHSDSTGATARYGKGDVQWMTAGRGIAHAEMFPLLDQSNGNTAELFQIWLNLPRKDKLVAPHFAMFWNENVPKHEVATAGGGITYVTQVAGKLGDVHAPKPPPSSWASRDESDLAIWSMRMTPGASFTLPQVMQGTVRALYFFKGDTLAVAGRQARVGHGFHISGNAAVEIVNPGAEAEILLLQARPLGEPVVQYGPFVMNTQEEIRQAYADFQRSQFGGWTFEGDAPVHSRETGRFARHSDGRIERAT
jgi:quercetin 2,3-dioxygenase